MKINLIIITAVIFYITCLAGRFLHILSEIGKRHLTLSLLLGFMLELRVERRGDSAPIWS